MGRMEGPKRAFASEVAALEAALAERRSEAVGRLRAVHEAWARALLGVADAGDLVAQVRGAVDRGVTPPRAAEVIAQLHAAEERQWEIGTWATGSGEGLSSMAEVRALQLAQAWLWTARISHDPVAAARARELVDAVATDPNGLGEPHTSDIEALHRRLPGIPEA